MNEDKARAKAIDTFTQFLAGRKLRDTRERRAILDTTLDLQGHFTVDDLCRELEKADFHVARSTVYATTELLVDCGLLRCHSLRGGAVEYERRTQGTTPHFHAVCRECGRTRQIKEPEIARLLGRKRYPSFTVTDVELYVYGLCHKCRARRSQPAADKEQKQ